MIKSPDGYTPLYDITIGVLQGDKLASLYSLYISYIYIYI